ncbi:DUF4857 domain-containing protein [Bacteroides helcogenes]|uniref:DUF4857 domain-containing protein n=1 Tax=Bacteroides helcogenes (strain ATCC 35417 / DSM 20613 / JCM 6297 / CCUG 15421 / P 36-108) TaxID=693979 RepID=E6SS27_BACT6|nr:DUF4857 domain-containing protein [Bacteroides helcogenes]ADV43129.1 hypothetical protein Bache_1119 [Bacteroides helcogenes P 36-108]MDY5239107.1 DUF4857 domain-containing protein [Bacteroides helcogenes]
MIRFSRFFLSITIILLLLWQLPWCYTFFTAKPSKAPFTLYSTIIGDFVSIGNEEGKGIIRRDQSGNIYSQEETDSILPFFYIRQLMSDERFPDSIKGVSLTPREVQMTNFNFRSVPSDINASKIGLYPLLESMSGRVELSMPDDVFRITYKGIEFIQIKANAVDTDKSRLFTDALTKKKFKFPSRLIAGNPTTRKEYDEGYLILDNEGKLFHMKQMKGRPYVRAISLPEGVKVNQLFVTEFKSRKTLGFLTDTDNHFYVLNSKTYELVKTGVPTYDPKKDAITIFGNMFDWTVCIKTDNNVMYYALDANNYKLLRSIQSADENTGMPGLHFTSSEDKYVKPRF